MNTSIITVSYNNHIDTIECLQSLLALTNSNYNIFIIDNSTNTSSIRKIVDWLEEPIPLKTLSCINVSNNQFHSKLEYAYYKEDEFDSISNRIHLPKYTLISSTNRGFAAANNTGIKWSQKYFPNNNFWILNNDTVVAPDSLNKLIQFHEKSELDLIGSVLMEYHDPSLVQTIGDRYFKMFGFNKSIIKGKPINELKNTDKIEIDYPSGASLFVTKKFITEVGLMEEKYFLYYEELDWVLRGKLKGLKCGLCAESIVWHKGGATINKKSKNYKSKISDYFSIRNRILLTKKYFPYYIFSVYIFMIGVIINRIIKKQFDRVSFILKICFNPAISNSEIIAESISGKKN